MLIVVEQDLPSHDQDTLSTTGILSGLSAPVARSIASFHLFSSIASTNSYLLEKVQDMARGMHVCVADTQTQGYGQRGRAWASPPGNVYLSVASRTSLTRTQSNWLPLMIAVGVAEMLTASGAEEMQVKWPNDIYHRGSKLAGVLIERKHGWTVMGIGLNVISRKSLAPQLPGGRRSVATLDEALTLVPARNEIIACLLEVIYEVVKHCADASGSSLQARWSKFDMLSGRDLLISSPAGSVRGRAEGVSENAELLLDTGQQLRILSSSNITIHWRSYCST